MDETWRLVEDPPLPGAVNMQRDLKLLQEVVAGAAPPTLRLYRWSPPAVSLGFSQPDGVVNREACRRLGVEVVRRPTGGRAVLHHRELTYSVTVPENHLLAPRSVLAAYCLFCQGLLEAFRLLSIEAAMAPEEAHGAGKGHCCFDTASAYEIRAGGKKVVGSAQLRRYGGILQHGSILLELSPDLYGQVLGEPGRGEETAALLAERAAGLQDLGYQVTVEELSRAVVEGFSRALQVRFTA